jgi:hypothetical protein
MALNSDQMRGILHDVKGNVEAGPHYTNEMKRWRRQQEAKWAEHKVDHPDDEMHIPEELPDADIVATGDYDYHYEK